MTTAPIQLPEPRILRGTLFSLIVLPVGIALWVLVWSLGFISAIVAFVIAFGAVYLFRVGAGGRVGKIGVLIVSLVVLVTLVLAFIAGLVVDYARFISEEFDLPFGGLFSNPLFWESFGIDLPALLNGNIVNMLLALAFAVLGTFGTLRNVLKSEAAADAAAAAPAVDPTAPVPGAATSESTVSAEPTWEAAIAAGEVAPAADPTAPAAPTPPIEAGETPREGTN